MKQKFTPEQLVQYIYRETSAATTMAINESLREDWELQEEYRAMRRSFRELPKVTFQPSVATLQNILSYSSLTAVETSH